MADKKFGVKQINLIGASGTPTLTSPNNLNINAINVAISTDLSVGGDVSIGGTFNALSVSGVSTFQSNVYLGDNDALWFGDGVNPGVVGDLQIKSDGTDSYIEERTSALRIYSNDLYLQDYTSAKSYLRAQASGSVELYYDNSKKFETTTNGVTVTGTTNTNQLVVSGISTLGASTVFTTVDNLGNIGIGTNRAINDYSGGNSVLSIHGRTWPGNPTVAGSGLLRIYSNETLLGSIYGSDLTGIGFGRNFNIDSAVPMSISCGTTIGMYGTTEIQQLKVTGVSTFQSNVSVTGVCTATSLYGDASRAVSGKWTLGANGTSNYTFDGVGVNAGNNYNTPMYLARGCVYEFVNNSGGSHPFQIRVSNGGAAYSTGVTNNGASSGTIRFEVPMDAPNSLYYQCTSHSGMGGTITVYPDAVV